MEPLRSEEAPDRTGLVSRTVRLSEGERPAPRDALAAADAPRTYWSAPDEATVVGSGAAATIRADGPDRFEEVRDAAADLFAVGDVHAGALAARPRLFGGFAFHDEHDADTPWTGYPGAKFVLPQVQLTYTDSDTWLTVNDVDVRVGDVEDRLAAARDAMADLEVPASADPPGVAARERTTSRAEWREGVAATVDRIRAGELRKVVLAQALETQLERPLSVPDALSRLEETYPDCVRFLVEPDVDPGEDGDGDGDGTEDGTRDANGRADEDADGARNGDADGTRVADPGGTRNGDEYGDAGDRNRGTRAGFFGATPERLVGLRGRTLETGALAGTTGRGDTPPEDEWLASELLDDDKNVHEHELVADAIRDQLEPYAAAVRTGGRGIRRLANVQHIETPIAAELSDDEHVLTLVEALHPTPAVGGLPPAEALRTIRDIEPFERGWYAAPVGWFDAAGHGSFAVALRSAVARGDAATLFAGVGVVADSDPDREWEEVQLKYRPILDQLE